MLKLKSKDETFFELIHLMQDRTIMAMKGDIGEQFERITGEIRALQWVIGMAADESLARQLDQVIEDVFIDEEE